jgi:signal transduction histidine kinase
MILFQPLFEPQLQQNRPVSVKMDLTASMIATISFGFIIFRPDMNVESINRTGLEMLGLSETDIGGPLCSKLFDIFPNLSFEIPWEDIAAQKDRKMLCQSVETTAIHFAEHDKTAEKEGLEGEKEGEKDVSSCVERRPSPSHMFDAEASISSVLYDKFLYFALIFSDVTERNSMIQELKVTQRHLEEVNDEMEQRVHDRTKELEKLNQTLLLEIEERKRADAKAQEAAESRSLFLSTVNHEIRTPANGILATAELLDEICSTDEQRQLLDILRISAVNLTSMVNRIVEFSRLYEGEFVLQWEVFTLARVIEDVSIFVGTNAPARRKSKFETPSRMEDLATSRVPLYLVVHEDVRELEVIGDPSAVRHVLHHVVTNARKFTDSGYILVRVRKCEPPVARNEEEKAQLSSFTPQEGTTWVKFDVEDTGIGISKKKMENLYVPFGQDGWEISRKYRMFIHA